MSAITQHLTVLALAFPVPPIDPRTIAVYANALKDQDPPLLLWAVNREIETAKHFPRVADLLARITERKRQLIDEDRETDRRRLLEEPTNQNPPNLMDLLRKQRERGGPPRKLVE